MHPNEKSIAAVLMLMAVCGCGPVIDAYDRNFDYAAASEEQQQRYLEGAANRFALGARLGGGDMFEVTQVFADASVDLMSVSVKAKDPSADYISGAEVESLRKEITKEMCVDVAKKIGLDKGYTIRMRFFKHSGAQLMTVQVDKDSCARHLA